MPLFSVDYAYTHLASCREIGNCDIKVVKKVVVPEVRNILRLPHTLTSFMFLTNVFTKKADTSFSLSFCGKCVVANFSIFERFKIKTPLNDECLSMYIINTIPHEKCFVRYLRTRCFLYQKPYSFAAFTRSISDTSTYRTPALSMKYSLYTRYSSIV